MVFLRHRPILMVFLRHKPILMVFLRHKPISRCPLCIQQILQRRLCDSVMKKKWRCFVFWMPHNLWVWGFCSEKVELYVFLMRDVVKVVAVEFAFDLGCGLPWGKPTVLCLLPVKDTLCWSGVVLCACVLLHLFSVVFCAARAVNKFHFRRVMNETPNGWRPVDRRSSSDTESCFGQDLCVVSRPSSQ